MNFADVVARHRRSLLALIALAIVAGVAAGFRLPVGLFPDIAFPRIAVSIESGDRPIEQTETVITRPLEQAVRAVPGVASLRSTTSRGAAEIKIDFAWGSDMNLAVQRTQAALARTVAALPPGVTFTLRRMDPTVFPVAAYSLTSDRTGPVALRRYAEQTLTPLLATVPGVARVDSLGGGVGEYRVEADPERLRAYGLSLADIATALAGANVAQASGKLEDRGKLFQTLADSGLSSVADLEKVALRSPGGGLIRLGDVATVRLAPTPVTLRVTADGRNAVSVQVYQQPSGDTVRIVRDVSAVFAKAKASAPPGLTVKAWYDQSELITASARGLAEAIAVGAVLAALVLLVFLRSFGVTLAAVVIVPATLALTVLLLALAGQSFNIMTLGGMAAAIGLIIDDAIVVIEQMERRLAPEPERRLASLRNAAHEVFRPLAGSSAATILIFLPLAFLTGVTGAFFKALALTMAIALTASFLLSWLVVPIIVERLYRHGEHRRRPASKLVGGYRRLLEQVTARPWIAAVVMIPLAAAGALAFARLPSGFIPHMDEGGFILDYVTPPGTSVGETDRQMRQIEAILARTPEVATWSRRTGAQLGGALTESNTGDFFIRLKPPPRRAIAKVMDEVRGEVLATVPGVDVETAQLIEDLIGDLTSVPQPIEVKLFGDDETLLHATAKEVARRLGDVRGVTEMRSGVVVAGDALAVHIDLTKAALENISPDDAARQLGALQSGQIATQIQTGPLLTDVRVWIPAERRDRASLLAGLPLRAADGHILPLSRIATVETLSGQAEIERDGGRRMVPVTARVEGRDLGSAAKDVRALLRRPGALPAGISFEMGGLFAEQQSAFAGLALVFAAALAIVAILLLLIYENLRIVAAIALMPLMAACAVGVGLWLVGVELDIMALMGLTMIIGIVTEVAIFYFTEYAALTAAGAPPREALLDAGAGRLRPIAMTTLAAILALTPLALGSSMQKPLAIAIIAGLIAQGPLVLLVMPALFRLIGGVGREAEPA